MKIVQRVKVHGADFGPSRTHFVTRTNPSGHILGLTERKDEALQMSDAEAEAITAYHAGREHAGELTILDA